VLIVADEVQSGIARTGKWFASDYEAGFEPDMVTIAKGIAGGMPISAVTGRADVLDAAHAGGIGGTYGGNPVAAAAAVAVLEQIEAGGVLERAQAIEAFMFPRLLELKQRHAVIGDVRGRGAMLAIELVEPGTKNPNVSAVNKVVSFCHSNGVLVLNAGTHGNVIRFLPPLAITDEQLTDALNVLDAALAAAL
jgi:4-aminobutyrate aminotransferase/(S)-3-amino-2-methylpropionate transaminase